MDYVHDTPVEQLMRKRPVFLWHAAAPVGAPVDRHDDNISRTLRRCNALRDGTEGAFGKIGDEGNARSALVRPPGRGNSAVRSPDTVDQHPAAIANIHDGGTLRLSEVLSGSGGMDLGVLKHPQRLSQSGAAPVQDVIVRDDAAVNPSGRETRHVRRVHSIVNALPFGVFACSDAGFQVNNTEVRLNPVELFEHLAPDIGGLETTRDGSITALCHD